MVDWDRRRELIAEYEASQRSAEHFDTLLWTVSSIFWAANSVLLGSVIEHLFGTEKCDLENRVVLSGFAAIGICLAWAVKRFVWSFNNVRNIKYRRCHVIEEQLGFSQHLLVDDPSPLNDPKIVGKQEVKPYESGRQKRVVLLLVLLFTFAWIGIGVWAWVRPPVAGSVNTQAREPCEVAPSRDNK